MITREQVQELRKRWMSIGHTDWMEVFDTLSALMDENEKLRRVINDYTEHTSDCILTMWEAGEPTKDGGYRTKYAGRWYQSRPIDETPKCNCGLDEDLAALGEEKNDV